LVADLRAPTPSVAAELVTPKKEDLKERLNALTLDIKRSFKENIMDFQQTLDDLAHRLALLNPLLLIKQHQAKLEDIIRQIYVRMEHFFKLRQARFQYVTQNLGSLSPLNILSRGYSITFKFPEGRIIKDASSLKNGEMIRSKLDKGELISQVTEVESGGGD
jgi:exodeoxyribonuclease VII large subunit